MVAKINDSVSADSELLQTKPAKLDHHPEVLYRQLIKKRLHSINNPILAPFHAASAFNNKINNWRYPEKELNNNNK